MGWCLIIPADSLSFTLSYILDLLPAVSAESFWHVALWESTGLLEAVKHVSLNRGGNSQLPDSSMKTPCKLSQSKARTTEYLAFDLFVHWRSNACFVQLLVDWRRANTSCRRPRCPSNTRDLHMQRRVQMTPCYQLTDRPAWNWHDVSKTNRRTYTFRVCPSDLQDLYVRILIVSMYVSTGG